jgi:Bacterial cadherin-like domain
MYQGNLNFTGTDTLVVTSTDAASTMDVDLVLITINSVNDVPVNTVPTVQTGVEDSLLTISGISLSDVDSNLLGVQLNVNNGRLSLNLAGGANIVSGAQNSASITLSGTQAQLNFALATLSYIGNQDFNGADTVAMLTNDTNGGIATDSITITITAVNDLPTFSGTAKATVIEGGSVVIARSMLALTDVDTASGDLVFTKLAMGNFNAVAQHFASVIALAKLTSICNSFLTSTLAAKRQRLWLHLAPLSGSVQAFPI